MEAERPDLTTGSFTWGGASILIRPVPKHRGLSGFWLTNFQVEEELRRQGIGTQFGQMLIDEADRTNVHLWTDVIPTQTHLVMMYASGGFVREPEPFPSPADALGAVQLWRPPSPQ